MLSGTSTLEQILRAMYLYGADYLIVRQGEDRLYHKDQLVGLLERGKKKVTLDELCEQLGGDSISSRARVEEAPRDATLLLYANGELSRADFEEYRAGEIKRGQAPLPDWWDAPLPLLFWAGESLQLNESAQKLIPGEVESLQADTQRIIDEGMMVLSERTIAISPLQQGIYLLEDISGDFEMAEDLVWWAAVGRALVRRMEDNGLLVRRLSPLEEPPAAAIEVISCPWEGESMGRLAIELPATEGEGAEQAGTEQAETDGQAHRGGQSRAEDEGRG